MRLSISRFQRNLFAALLLASGMLVTGCAQNRKPPVPLTAPGLEARVSHHPGAPLATSRPATTLPTSDALAVNVEWLALRTLPTGGQPIGSASILIAAAGEKQPLLIAPRLLSGTRVISPVEMEKFIAGLPQQSEGQPSQQSVDLGTSRGVLPSGVTARFVLAPQSPGDQRIEVEVYRPPTTQPASATANISLVRQAPATQPSPPLRERAELDPLPLKEPMQLALMMPYEFDRPSEAKALVALITISDGEGLDFAEAMAKCQADLKRAGEPADTASTQPSQWPQFVAALKQIEQSGDTRRAMLFLAGQSGATLTGDCAMVADDAAVQEIGTAIRNRLSSMPPMNAERLGCVADSATFSWLAAQQSAEKLAPELSTALVAFAGEAGRHAGSLDAVMQTVATRQEIQARLIAENLIYLEDASPSARVRAYDWLKAIGRAPANFDPLGPLKARRDALSAAIPTP